MDDQLDLIWGNEDDRKEWNPKHHHHRDDIDTAVAAAHSAENLSEIHCEMIERALRMNPEGMTCQEIGDLMGLDMNQVSRRLVDCRKRDENFADSGLRRPTRSGRQSAVWIIDAVKRYL